MKVKLIMFRGAQRREFDLNAESTIIGRRPECTLRVPTRDVSRQHCEIRVSSTGVSVKDLGSSNGTYVNGKRVAESPLAAGDKLRVGPIVFLVQIDGKPPAVSPEDVAPAASAAGAKKGPAPAELDEDDLFDLGEEDFDIDDPLTQLMDDDDDDDDVPPRPAPKPVPKAASPPAPATKPAAGPAPAKPASPVKPPSGPPPKKK